MFSLAGIALMSAACTDIENPFESSKVENVGNNRLSSFLLPESISEPITDSVDIIQISGSYMNRFLANIEVEKDIAVTEIQIPNNTSIPNGDYVIKFDSIANRFIAAIDGERIAVKEVNNGGYSVQLNGMLSSDDNGSRSHPYKIGNKDKLNKFIKALKEDPYHGAGLHFIQTGDISWANDEANTGEGLASASFAGVYDGDGYTLSDLTINGKSNSGLFTTLTNGAVIKNLSFSDLSFSNGSSMGAIAGNAEYTTSISGINLSGNLSGIENIGGLIGAANGNISISNSVIGASVTGMKNIGGAIGYVHSRCHADIRNLSVTSSFRVGSENASASNDAENAGGIIGYVENSSFEISDSEIIHTSSYADNTIVISANNSGGGLVGRINGLYNSSAILSTRVISPLKVNDFGGGFIGNAQIGNTLRIADCQSCIISKQGNHIGGIIGSLECSDKNQMVYENNDVVASDNSDIHIGGDDNVGGIFGYIKANEMTFKGKNHIVCKVTGNKYVGGITGYMENTVLDINKPLYGKSEAQIIGLNIEAGSYAGGIAGYMKNSTLKGKQSLKPTSGLKGFDDSDVDILCTIKVSGRSAGGAVGEAYKSTITGLKVKATLTNTSDIYTGGIVGLFDDGNKAVSSCSFSGEVSGKDYTGGIVGEINKLGQITQCINYATVTGGTKIGGIVGKVMNRDDEPWVNECVNLGNVTGNNYVSGIAGYVSADKNEANDWTKVARCGNYGNITASSSGDGCVGGIVGKCDSDKIRVNDCANHGTITGNGTFKGIGGIAGSLGMDAEYFSEYDNVDVYHCANTGKIVSDHGGEANMGGIVGYMEEGDVGTNDTNSQVHLCYNCGNVGPAKEATHGGIIGHADYSVSLRFCINYGNTEPDGEAMIGTVKGTVYNRELYHLEGTGDRKGNGWESESFNSDEMQILDTFFEGYEEQKKWMIAVQANHSDSTPRAILKDEHCPFQNIVK